MTRAVKTIIYVATKVILYRYIYIYVYTVYNCIYIIYINNSALLVTKV